MSIKQAQKAGKKEYNEFIKELKVDEIYLKKVSLDYVSEEGIPSEGISVGTKQSSQYEIATPDMFRVFHTYQFTAKSPKTHEVLAKIGCTFVVVYKNPIAMNESIFTVFSELNLPLNTWPYFRELIHSLVGRMNWPPLVAPLYKP